MLRVRALRGDTQWLDGGVMFGDAPRSVWEQWCPPDARGRIPLASRALLIDEGYRKVLCETGIGALCEPRPRNRPEHVLLGSLAELGLSDADIDIVVLSHLHRDHEEGHSTPLEAETASRAWFPNARFVTSRRAYEQAKLAPARDPAAFVPGLLKRLEQSGRLDLVEHAHEGLFERHYRFDQTDGHTIGMLHTTVRGANGAVFFAADLVPGVPWVQVPITTGYDRLPEQLVGEKTDLLRRMAEEGNWVFFSHDPHTAWARVRREASGSFGTDQESAGDAWLILD